MSASTTMLFMGRKKSGTPSGPHKTKRTSVQVPDEWLEVARSRARSQKQPTLWFLLSLIEKDAKEAGVKDLPMLPWEKSDPDADDE